MSVWYLGLQLNQKLTVSNVVVPFAATVSDLPRILKCPVTQHQSPRSCETEREECWDPANRGRVWTGGSLGELRGRQRGAGGPWDTAEVLLSRSARSACSTSDS